MLADDLAKAIANTTAISVYFVAVAAFVVYRFWRKFSSGTVRSLPLKATDLLERANAYSIGFAKSAIYGASLGNTHLSAMQEYRDIRRISIPVTNETVASGRSENSRFECIAGIFRITELR
jgi:hypothetical protein